MRNTELSNEYKPSKIANILARVSLLLFLCGIAGPLIKGTLEAAILIPAVLLILAGAGLFFLSRHLSFQRLTNYYEAQGVADRIRNDTGDMELCCKVYARNPSRYMLNYITRLNPEGGAAVRQTIADKKGKR